MENRLFTISGNKVNTLLLTDDSLRMSSGTFFSVEEFEQAWEKKLTLRTKLQIRYDSIRSVTKEHQEIKFLITYKTWAGFPSECEFSLLDADDYAIFYEFLEKDLYFVKTDGAMLPFSAISRHLLGLLFVAVLTAGTMYVAMDIGKGVKDDSEDVKNQVFDYVVGLLGVKGVLAIGGAISCYIIYNMWKRFKDPPNRIKFARQ
jgi:hypothetical protein